MSVPTDLPIFFTQLGIYRWASLYSKRDITKPLAQACTPGLCLSSSSISGNDGTDQLPLDGKVVASVCYSFVRESQRPTFLDVLSMLLITVDLANGSRVITVKDKLTLSDIVLINHHLYGCRSCWSGLWGRVIVYVCICNQQ